MSFLFLWVSAEPRSHWTGDYVWADWTLSQITSPILRQHKLAATHHVVAQVLQALPKPASRTPHQNMETCLPWRTPDRFMREIYVSRAGRHEHRPDPEQDRLLEEREEIDSSRLEGEDVNKAVNLLGANWENKVRWYSGINGKANVAMFTAQMWPGDTNNVSG